MSRLNDADLSDYEFQVARTARTAVAYCEQMAARYHRLWSGGVPATLFTDREDRSAVARVRVGRRQIVLHWGLIEGIWNAALLLVSTSETVTKAFGWNVPAQIPKDLSRFSTLAHKWHPGRDENDMFAHAVAIFGRAIELVWFHEFSHHIRGHLERLDGRDIDEALHMAAHHSKDQNAVKIRDLELDADFFCINLLVQSEGERFRQSSEVSEDGRVSVDTVLSELYFRIASIMALNLVLDDPDRSVSHQNESDHPPAIHRAIRTSSMYLDAIHRRVALSRSDLEHYADFAWTAAQSVADYSGLERGRWLPGERPEKRMPLYTEEIERASDLIFGINKEMGLEDADDRPDHFDIIASKLGDDFMRFKL